MKIQQNKMMSYLAVTAGVGCVSSVANAAVVFYGNASNNNIQADPLGINIGLYAGGAGGTDRSRTTFSFFGLGQPGGITSYFTRGSNISVLVGVPNAGYYRATPRSFIYGAVAGAMNYVSVSFNGNDNVYEAVAQFFFTGAGNGYLMAIATTNAIPNPQNLSAVGGPALSISAGKAMIDAAAVPEPSSLGLLALGATGLLARRRRKQAA